MRSTLVIPSVYADQTRRRTRVQRTTVSGSSYRRINALTNPSIAHKSERKGGCGCDDVGMRDSESVSSHRPRLAENAPRLRCVCTARSAADQSGNGVETMTTVKRTGPNDHIVIIVEPTGHARYPLPRDLSRSRIDQPVIGRTSSFISRSTGTNLIIIIIFIIVTITSTSAVVLTATVVASRAHRRPTGARKDTWSTTNLAETATHARTTPRSRNSSTHRGCPLSLPPAADHDGALYRDVTKQSRTTHARAGWLAGSGVETRDLEASSSDGATRRSASRRRSWRRGENSRRRRRRASMNTGIKRVAVALAVANAAAARGFDRSAATQPVREFKGERRSR